MPNEDQKYNSTPIPTYEEAIAPRSQTGAAVGPSETSDDAERQGLLRTPQQLLQHLTQRDGRGSYRAPTVESDRDSSRHGSDSTFTSPRVSEDEELRRDIEEMEVIDPSPEERTRHRPRLQLPKALQTLRETLSAISLPSLSGGFQLPQSISSRFPTVPARLQIPWPILARLLGLFLIVAMVYILVVFKVLGATETMMGQRYMPESVRAFVQGNVEPKNIERYLWEMSYDDHIAGTKGDYFLAERVEEYFFNAGLDAVSTDNYEVYLNYPREDGRRVAIIDPPELAWEAVLEEDILLSKKEKHQSAVFHGHSKSDNVTGHLVYANYGSREDFARLKEAGIEVNGSIALVKYYGTQGDRALKIKAAELAGARGCIIYSDPGDDGYYKGPVWPDGPWRPSDSVQRGGVSLMSWVVGDVLTPGWASTPGADRVPLEKNPGLVNIPSLPLSWRDAKVLIKSLKGHGREAWDEWRGGDLHIEWWTGGSSSPIVQLMNLQDENEKQPIRNVIGRIQGVEQPDKTVYVGNHRDAWCFGAVDPGSGTAVFLEVVRVFGELVRLGWRPRRTIVFASWDAEEYNLIGSTEHVEERISQLRSHGVAYLNVDSAVSGHHFFAAASPVFRDPLYRVLDRVGHPRENKTLLQAWNIDQARLEGLGAGSDYVAFQDLAGTSSIDFGFRGKHGAYPYHSCYDSFDWMKKLADPDFSFHAAVARVWGLLILEIADEPLIEYDFVYYASEVRRYIDTLKGDITKAPGGGADKLDLQKLYAASDDFTKNADRFKEFSEAWNRDIGPSVLESRETMILRILHNTRVSNFETLLLDLPDDDDDRVGGIPGRTQFKHVIFGPQLWSGYDEAYFPAVRDMMEKGDWEAAQQQVDIAAERIRQAARKLLY